MNPYQFLFGQEKITILHWNKETFRDESLKRQQLVEVNQAGISGALTASEARRESSVARRLEGRSHETKAQSNALLWIS